MAHGESGAFDQDENDRNRPTDRTTVRFTPSNGLRGWHQARAKGLPCYGLGSVEISGSALALRGWQRTWLGVAAEAEILVSKESIRNVAHEGTQVCCECKIGRRWRTVEFAANSESEAARICESLPATRTAGFATAWTELRDFNQRLNAVTGKTWVTPTIALLNVAAFVLIVVASRSLLIDPAQLSRWGANVGMLTSSGEWWRLFAATLLHLSLAHLAFNMWALWNVGQLTERLYGSWTYLAIYVACGVLASLFSTAWNPSLMSVGASGAIFGIFGAFLAFLLHGQTRVPASIVRTHRTSTLFFVGFNLISGALQPAIDNAAHVGGLVSGFLIGWLLARPLDASRPAVASPARLAVAVALIAVTLGAGVMQVRVAAPNPAGPYIFWRTHDWYPPEASRNVRLWEQLAFDWQAGRISEAEFGERFRKDVFPFWESARKRLDATVRTDSGNRPEFGELILQFTTLRHHWAKALVDGIDSSGDDRFAKAAEFRQEADLLQARIDRAQLRDMYDWGPKGLRSQIVGGWHTLLAQRHWTCIEPAPGLGRPPGKADSQADGPAARHAIGCEAQHLFVAAKYGMLDAELRRYTANLADLPDGSSTLSGASAGLDALFESGGIEIPEALARLSDWRREVPGSVYPDLFEAMLFSDWAWSARGHGYVKYVRAQDQQAFAYRTEMAATTLRELGDRANSNPLWYQLSINAGVDQSSGITQIRKVFEAGVARFPEYQPLYGAMLRALMPRWLGSAKEVAEIVAEISSRAGRTDAMYARLYWTYCSLEGDNSNVFEDGRVSWPRIQAGFREMIRNSPRSDYLLNAYANFACRQGDASSYALLRRDVGRRPSATAWTDSVSLSKCDEKFALQKAAVPPSAAVQGDGFVDAAGNRMTETDVAWVKGQVRAALEAAEPMRKGMAQYAEKHGRLPPDDTVRDSAEFRRVDVMGAMVEVGLGGSINMKLTGGPLKGHSFSWTPTYKDGGVEWSCAQETMPEEYLGPPCRDDQWAMRANAP